MVDIKETIELFRSLSDTYQITSVRRSIRDLQEKTEDKTLYLAVVGEFSSGKSTFVNALLGRRILKEAVMPTTACATYISKGGDEIEITVVFGEDKFRVTGRNLVVLSTYIKENYGISITSMQHLIDTLTSNQAVACDVTALFLSIPKIDIPDDIVIIDTPGFNPGDLSVRNHFDITKEVVEKYADAALILMPSDQPFSNSVKIFMRDHLHKYMHRCVYVLTMGDHKNEEERRILLDFVHGRLASDFRQESAKVFCESAITMLPVVRIPDNMKEEWKKWQSEFDLFKQFMWTHLVRQKEIILAEHIHNIVLDLSKEMKKSLYVKQNDLELHKKKIDSGRVTNIETLTNQLALNAKNEIAVSINEVRSKLEKEIKAEKNSCLSYARGELTEANVYKFHSEVEPVIVEDAEERSSHVLQTVNEALISLVKSSVNKNVSNMQKEFTRHYSIISSLPITDKGIKLKIGKIKSTEIDFDDTNQLVSKTNERGGKALFGGATAGATAGAVIGSAVPIIGTTLGAIAGGIAGFLFGSSKSDKLDRKVYPSVKKAMGEGIKTYFNSVQSEIKNEITKQKKKINKAIDDYAKRHVMEYGDAVEKLILQKEEESATAQKAIDNLKEQIRFLEDIEHETEYNLVRLKERK